MEKLRQQVRPFIERSISLMSDPQSEAGSEIRRRHSMRSSSISSNKTEKEKKYENKEKKINERKGMGGRLIEAEFSETASVKWDVYKTYFQMIGFSLIAFLLFSYMASNIATIFSGLWLSEWSNDALDPQKVKDQSLRDLRLGVYAGIGLTEALFMLLANVFMNLACIRAAKLLHNKMLEQILEAPMAFFGLYLDFLLNKIFKFLFQFSDTTPIGRILNRFSKDVDTADMSLLWNVRSMFIQFFRTIVAFAMISLETPIILAAIFPLAVIYYLFQRIYIPSSRQLKRIDSTSRSPIYNHFSETVNGSTSIRAFGASEMFIKESNKRVDANNSCYYPSFTANRWLSFRLEFLGYSIVFISAIFAVVSRNTLSPGIAGLAISYSMDITGVLGKLVRSITDLETNIVSVERIVEYTETPTEV